MLIRTIHCSLKQQRPSLAPKDCCIGVVTPTFRYVVMRALIPSHDYDVTRGTERCAVGYELARSDHDDDQ